MTISIHDRVEDLAAEWERLADAQGAPPWLRPGWFTIYGRAFGVRAWRIHAVRRDGRLAGVIPLVPGRFGLASPSNWHTPEFGPLVEPDARAELARSVFDTRSSSVGLSFVDRSDGEVGAWEATAASSGYRVLARALERSPYVDLAGGWEAYEATLGRKLKSELRRRRRRLADQGEVVFEFCEGGEQLGALLDEGFRVEASGWKGERGSSIASQASTSAFYRELAGWAATRGWLRIALLRVGGRAIAFDFALEDARVHALLKTGFDPGFGRWAPGMLLRYEMLSRAFASGVERYDFLGADEPWKLEWARATRERSLVQAFAPSVAGRAGWTAFARGRPLAKRVVQAVRR